MVETYKTIIGFEGLYEVSNTGKVRSLDRIVNGKNGLTKLKGKILKTSLQRGYKGINLFKNGKIKRVTIHRMVGIHFIDNPNNYKCINHIDGNKLNNNVSNLEWCNHLQNLIHARILGLNKSEKKIAQFDFYGNKLNDFKSLADASRYIGKYEMRGNITRAIKNNKTAFGFKWKYETSMTTQNY